MGTPSTGVDAPGFAPPAMPAITPVDAVIPTEHDDDTPAQAAPEQPVIVVPVVILPQPSTDLENPGFAPPEQPAP